jgi:multiple sugar transport system permease protein
MNFNRRIVVWFAALIVVVNGFFPAVWILLTSLKTETELLQVPITYLPQAATLENYVLAFTAQPICAYVEQRSSRLSTILCVFVSALAAYALTRRRVPRRNLIMSLLLAVAMFPLISLMVPLFKVMRELGLLNTYLALILPYTVLSMPICTLVMASFFQDIPPDLEAAAMIDGCSRVGALFKVVVPLSAPGVFTAAILAFVNAWRVPAGIDDDEPRQHAHAVGRHHPLSGRVRVPLAPDFGGTHHRHRPDLHPDRHLPGARGRRPDLGRSQGVATRARSEGPRARHGDRAEASRR